MLEDIEIPEVTEKNPHNLTKKDKIKIKKFIKKVRNLDQKQKEYLVRSFYELRSVLGYWWAIFYILLGGRDAGKSYAVEQFFVDQFMNKGIPFYWIRLTPTSADELLISNAAKLIDAEIRRIYKLDLVVTDNKVYHVTKRTKPEKGKKEGRILEKKLMCTVLALSNFYNDKGSAYYDFKFLNDPNMYYNICLDEMNREKNERKTFDIAYAFVNQIENLVRETNYRIRLIMIGNTLDVASDLMCLFNFLPEEFGRYTLVKNKKKLTSYLNEIKYTKTNKEKIAVKEKYVDVNFGKRAVVEYMPLTEHYKLRRQGSVADTLMPKASTFANRIDVDTALVYKGRLIKPYAIIKFTKNNEDWFTLWQGNDRQDNIVAKYNKEKLETVFTMRKYIDDVFTAERQKVVIDLFDTRNFKFRDLITFKRFQKFLEEIKPQK